MSDAGQSYRSLLERLAIARGVATSYTSAWGDERRASDESLRGALESMGSPCAREAEALESIEALGRARSERLLDPVVVSWAPERGVARLGRWIERASVFLQRESGAVSEWTVGGCDAIELPENLEDGYHELVVEHVGRAWRAMVVRAPVVSYAPDDVLRGWGVFCPIYAIRRGATHADFGCGDLSGFAELGRWAHGLGASAISTLPLLAQDLTEPFQPTPYVPVSKLFWNELFLDPEALPELKSCEDARALLARVPKGGDTSLVDYRRSAATKRTVLEALAERFWNSGGAASEAFGAFERSQALIHEYAMFRARTEFEGRTWHRWTSTPGAPFRETDARYHAYVQFRMGEALASLRERTGAELYLDLPVGVSRDGFDAWRFRSSFCEGCSIGAPPDPYFTEGQDWGFAPPDPDGARDRRYDGFIAGVRNHMRYADILRIDHVMALHRLYWIPRGMGASEGVYVSYPSEDLLAIVSLESHRNRCRVVGEDLGTVPPEVRASIDRHAMRGLFIVETEMQPDRAMRSPPANCVASLNTHDMAPFAEHWSGDDIERRIGVGILGEDLRDAERDSRERSRGELLRQLREAGLLGSDDGAGAVRDALHTLLAGSDAELMLLNLEDLWLETEWQNMPGTVDEHPNWRRRLRMTLDEMTGSNDLGAMLERLTRLRESGADRDAAARA